MPNPSFYNDAVKGLRDMVDGRWGAAKIEQTSLDGRVHWQAIAHMASSCVPEGGYKAKLDRGEWVQIDDIINEDRLWESVYFELRTNGHEHRGQPGNRICYDGGRVVGQRPPTADELMHHRAWAITLAIGNELWNWDRPRGNQEDGFRGRKIETNYEQ